MPSRALPLSKLQKRRRRRLIMRASLAGGAVLVLLGSTVALARAPFLRISTITISGTETLASSTLQSFATKELSGSYYWLFPKNNAFIYPRRALVADTLAAFPRLKSASVRAHSFSSLSLSVAEREPAAQWCGAQSNVSTSSCLLLDAGGEAYAPAPQFEGGSASIYRTYFGPLANADHLPAQFLTPPQFTALAALVQTLEDKAGKAGSGPLTSVSVDSDGNVRMQFESGFAILFELSQSGALTTQHFEVALQTGPFTSHPLSDFQYLDLRFGEKLYYKLNS